MAKRAAIVIGVNRTAALDLPVLHAATSGAREFGEWLKREGFDVYPFLDDDAPVRVHPIAAQVRALVEQHDLQQLVIYFAGHGFVRDYRDEMWMLSHAPDDANEAISVSESIELARECRIPSVVIVSDACRSKAESLNVGGVRGSLIFPNRAVSRDVRPAVDRYFATLRGDPAQEMVVAESARYEGVFTHCFLGAYQSQDADVVRRVESGGRAYYVLPNRRLAGHLYFSVPALIRDRGLVARQSPDAIVESGDDVYIGRVTHVFDPRTSEACRAGGLDDMGTAMDIRHREYEALVAAAATRVEASERLVADAQTRGAGHFETRTGFKVFGTRVSEVVGLDMEAELLSSGDGDEPAYVRLHPGARGTAGQRPVSSVVLRFADGSGTVLAGLDQYIGTVVTEDGRVVNVSYVPSDNSELWQRYKQKSDQLEKLRAIVAAAARHGVFRVDPEKAKRTADQIRYLKAIDPTLGLYAAYAYAEVGKSELAESVLQAMADDLNAALFDVALLAGKLAEGPARDWAVPFCPMLTQGWSLLRVKRVDLPPLVKQASDGLLPALWTTFDPAGMDLIFRGLREGTIR